MSYVSKSLFATALLSTSAIGLAAPAAAQDADAKATSYGEIVVSARRREETLQETPVSITAVNAEMLESTNATDIGSLMGKAPNLLITNQNSGGAAANLSIRGLTYADVEKSQEPTVGVVVDGVFIGTSTGQFFDLFDIEQIEVLRGPQGTLFGRNTIGGVINIRRSRPTGEFGIKADVSYGNYNTLTTRAVVNAPIGDNIGIKAWYFHNENEGYYKHAATGNAEGFANNENFGLSARIASDDDAFEAVLTVEKQIQDFDPRVSPITNSSELFSGFSTPAEVNRNQTSDVYTVFGLPALGHYEAPALTAELNYDAGAVQLTSITGLRESTESQTQDFDGIAADLYYTDRQQTYKQFSQELRASGDLFDGFDYVVGAYYFESDYTLKQWTRLFAFNPTVSPKAFDTNHQSVAGSTKSVAFFGDFNWSLTDTVRLSFGGRWTRDKKTLSNGFATTGLVGSGSKSFTKFTPKAGLDWRPNNDMMLYASWSRGYRSGGFSPRAATAATASTPYNPEVVDSFEVGGKFTALDGKLLLNIAGFWSEYKGLQQNTTIPGGPTGNQTITANVGTATIKGIESDFVLEITPELSFNGAMGYLNNDFSGFIVGGIDPSDGVTIVNFDYSNNEMIYAPKFTASFGATYDVPTSFGSIVANASYRYIGRYDQQISTGGLSLNTDGSYTVLGNDPRVRTDKQGLLDASLRANFELGGADAHVTVWGKNLANDKGTTHAFTVAGLWSFATARAPRTFGATVGFEF